MLSVRLPLVLVAMVACVACDSTEEATGLTGIDLTVRFDTNVTIEELNVSGTVDGQPAFAPGLVPQAPRPLDGSGETLLLLLDADLAEQMILIRVDGLSSGALVASAATQVTVVADQLVRTSIMLGPPPRCGDGTVEPGLEACDDDNEDTGDGCNDDCEVEAGWNCSNAMGAASVCERLPACSDTMDNDLDGLIDFDGGDDGCSDASDDSEAGNCTAACGQNGACNETCQQDDCSWTCDASACDCSVDCNEAATSCELTCAGNSCGFQCDGAGACTTNCQSGDCDIDCQASTSCDVSCEMSSSCDINCDGATMCSNVVCRSGSDCLLNCGTSADCGFSTCQGGGGAQSCANNVVVCNRPCP